MLAWQIWCIVGVLLFIVELFTPVLFFMNLAVAAFVVAIIAYFGISFMSQSIIFFVLSVFFVSFVRPLLLKNGSDLAKKTGIQAKYIGAQAKVVSDITKYSGRIAIYGEEWDARALNDELLPKDSVVKIVSNENLILYVEKI